ncbi:uncharacterized protein LOC144904097 [Branchiostoma floridae x Branchiostoma belcheri]
MTVDFCANQVTCRHTEEFVPVQVRPEGRLSGLVWLSKPVDLKTLMKEMKTFQKRKDQTLARKTVRGNTSSRGFVSIIFVYSNTKLDETADFEDRVMSLYR